MQEELLQRSRQGDQEAFEELVKPLQRPIFNLALRMLGDREDANDVTQEALTRAWISLPKLNGAEAFRTWVMRITVNLCHDTGRRRQRRPEEPLPDNIVELTSHQPGPEAATLQRAGLERVAEALARLPLEYRAAVVLRDVEDLDYRQIASVLGIPPGTVRSRISRGRLELRRILGASAEGVAEEL